MQNVSFNTIDELLEFLPEDERRIVVVLRKLILNCIPNVSEYLSYNIPCYKLNRSICYIWPGSVLWEKNKTFEGVRIGFNYGYLLRDESGYLDKGERKQVYWRDYMKINETDIGILKSCIFDAVEIDASFRKKK